ncbi:MAG: hypothetical protein IPH23_02540 [Gammaproteobacteria bacterium]|nr:hypothetical protein [Gammaproteobacteria bacterium]
MPAMLQREHLLTDRVVVMGDMNVAPRDIEDAIGEDNHVLLAGDGQMLLSPEEREWYAALTV